MSLTHHPDTVVSLLADLAQDHPEFPLYTLLDAARNVPAVLTSRGLLRKAQKIAGMLQVHGLSAEPVMVLSPYGPEFIELLFGVMLAGCMPVPVTFHRKLGMANIADIIADTGLRVITGQKTVLTSLQSGRIRSMPAPEAKRCELLCLPVENLSQTDGCPPQILPTDAALIYPGLPGGEAVTPVVLSHVALLNTVDGLMTKLSAGPADSLMTCHDLADGLALLMHILLPLRARCRSTFMPTEHALRDASTWLSAASQSGCSIISAPPAVLSQAAHQTGPKAAVLPDLEKVRFICVGGDHMVPCIVSRFIERYDSKGMSAGKILVCYGLSESCTFSTGTSLYCNSGSRHRFSVDGREFRAEEIESVVFQSFGARGLSRCVVLCLDEIKQIVLLAECATRQLAGDWQGVVGAMMATAQADTGCRLDRVMLLRPGSLPLSTSGMVLRQRCAAALADGSLMLRLLPVRGK